MEAYERRELDIERRKLWKCFRNMKRDYARIRSAFTLDLKYQRDHIKSLEHEGHSLQTDYVNMYCLRMQRADSGNVVKLQKLSAEKLKIEAAISNQRKLLQKLRKQLDEARTKFAQSKKVEFGPTTSYVMRAIRLKENTSNVRMVRFCTINTENAKLREIIQSQRIQSNVYKEIIEKVTLIIETLRQDCRETVKGGTLAHQNCDETTAKVRMRRENEDKERCMFRNKCEDLHRVMDYDASRMEFFKTVNIDRIGPAANLRMERYKAFATNKVEGYRKVADYYGAIWTKVQEMSGCKKVEQAILRYTDADMQNFSLMTFTTVQAGEINDLEGEITRLKKSIVGYRTVYKAKKDKQEEQIHTAEVKLRNMEIFADQWELSEKKMFKILAELCHWVQLQCGRFRTDLRTMPNPYHSSEGMTGVRTINCYEYLLALESRLLEMVNALDYMKYKRLSEEDRFRLLVFCRQNKDRIHINTLAEERKTAQQAMIRLPTASIFQPSDDDPLEVVNVAQLRQAMLAKVKEEEHKSNRWKVVKNFTGAGVLPHIHRHSISH